MIYFDSAYLAKCYLPEPGHREVRAFAASAGTLQSIALAEVEVAAVFHRHMREGRLRAAEHRELLLQFEQDCADGIVSFIPVSPALLRSARSAYRDLPAALFVRSIDCLHLVAARETGFKEIYSNDRHLLAAAPHFNLRGIDLASPA
jgi:predicted nucleic acid-binding protein